MLSKKFTPLDISNYTYKFIFDENLKFIEDAKPTKDFLDLIGGPVKTIMIDEFQDTSILQWKILNLIMKTAENIICVGMKSKVFTVGGAEKRTLPKT